MVIKKKKAYSIFNPEALHPSKKLYSSLFTAFCKSTPFLVKTKKNNSWCFTHVSKGTNKTVKGWKEFLAGDVVTDLGDASLSHHFLSQIITIFICLFFMEAEQPCIINYILKKKKNLYESYKKTVYLAIKKCSVLVSFKNQCLDVI